MTTSRIPERLLRQIWSEQRFCRNDLHTAESIPLEILDPGVSNSDGGPDFLDARIRLGETLFSGDVELHTEARGWYEHLHNEDPHYNRTILHVVLTAEQPGADTRTESGRSVPLLVLHPFLDERMLLRLNNEMANDAMASDIPLPCLSKNSVVPSSVILHWLEKLGWERLEQRIRRFEERIRQLILEQKQSINEPYRPYHGNPRDIPNPQTVFSRNDFADKSLWEQLLYEGTVEGLGYSKNSDPFLTLSQSVPIALLRGFGLDNATSMMALLFGTAGLLPRTRSLADQESRMYVRLLRRKWEELRAQHTGHVLHPGEWKFFRLRPSNFPTARLASICFLLPRLFTNDAFREIIAAFADRSLSDQSLLQSLRARFSFESDEYWSFHYRFGERSAYHTNRIGASRRNDIIANVFLPVILLYARLFNEPETRSRARSIVSSLRALQSNSITRKLERELLHEENLMKLMVEQQGAIRLYTCYCTCRRCGECEIGKAVGL